VRGLLDVVLVAGLFYGVYASTPLGAIIETGVRVARGQQDHPSWFATFRGRETAVLAPPASATSDAIRTGRVPASIAEAARTRGVDVDVLAAFVAARGTCDAAGTCTVAAPDRLGEVLLRTVGRAVAVDEVAEGLAVGGRALADAAPPWGTMGATERRDLLAVETLFVGVPAVRVAVAQAAASDAQRAADIDAHAGFLSPGLRRGPLQGALAVLLVHRLATLAWPGGDFRVTSSFGERIHPITGRSSFHNGVDIGMPKGTPVPSAWHGIVVRAGTDSLSGNYVIVDHGLGVATAYCHLDEHGVVERARVARRAPIGRSGSTGRSTGPHLHYVLRVEGKAVDPAGYGERAINAAATSNTVPDPRDR
jgi:murein DD-endopeptidase MepM/ murein hydrolase activator NlpD